MQISRELSKRMLEAVENVPIVDVYERLVPESKRLNQRFDFITWVLAYAGAEVQALGLEAAQLALLGDVNADPDERWSLLSTYWPYLRATGAGRVILHIVWELFGVEEINERSWKDISAQLWQTSKKGFYDELLHRRANIRMALVDNAVDSGTKMCCLPLKSYDWLMTIKCNTDLLLLETRFKELLATLDQIDAMVKKSVQRDIEKGCVSFKLGTLPDITVPSEEKAGWAFGRLLRSEDRDVAMEPALGSYLLHRFFEQVAQSDCPIQVHIDSPVMVERVTGLARLYPQVRFVLIYNGGADPYTLVRLGRALPNVALAVGDLWRFAPQLARQVLALWIQGVSPQRLFAWGGNVTMVEVVCVRAQAIREQIALLLSEMIAGNALDESDASFVMHRLLGENARDYFRLQQFDVSF